MQALLRATGPGHQKVAVIMKISVVTVVLNRQDTIADALSSIYRQSHPEVEHIIKDGGSHDRTLGITR